MSRRDQRPALRSVLHDEAGRQRSRSRRRAARHRGPPRTGLRRQRGTWHALHDRYASHATGQGRRHGDAPGLHSDHPYRLRHWERLVTESTTTKPTVLVLDDESGILDSLNILLRNEGFTPYLAQGGKRGLEQL